MSGAWHFAGEPFLSSGAAMTGDRGLILPMFLEHTIFQHFFEWTAPTYTGTLPSHVTEWFLQDRRVQNLIRPGPEQRGATDIVIQ